MTHGELQTQAGPVQVRGTVLTVRPVDAYYAMTLVTPAIAARFRPGQFITLAVGGPDTSMMLSRAFSIHDVRPDHGGTVEFVFAAQGRGTQWLAERRARDVLDVTGPLGRPFPLPRDPANCLLVGGGYGSAPLFALAARLRERGCEVDFLLGAGTGERVFGALTARRTGRSAAITTEDGSLGSRGLVTDLLDQVIHDGRTDVIYACGPMPMLRQVTVLARRYEIPVQVAVEEAMACGVGVCMTCVLPVVGSDGITRMSRSCVDGPVYRGEQVRWDDIGTIPFDAFGAPGWEPRAHRAAQVQGRAGQGSGGHGDVGPPTQGVADGQAADGQAPGEQPADGHTVDGPAVSAGCSLGAKGSADDARDRRAAVVGQQGQSAASGPATAAGQQGELAAVDGAGQLAATGQAAGPAGAVQQGRAAGAGQVGARGGGARGRGARRQGHGG
jgi:dihydroorotate dehydrogenase electron transfer subunit